MKKSHYLSLVALSLLGSSASSLRANQFLDFEGEAIGDPPADWVFNGDGSMVRIAATETSGAYLGGQGIQTDEGGASYAGFVYPGFTITSIQADFRWDFSEINTPTLAVYAWDDDDDDGFQAPERTIGFGLDNDGQFELSSEAGEIDGTINFVADTWYRLTMTWSDADESGNRTVTLTATDLTNQNDLGVVATSIMSADDFGVAPAEWDGLAFRMTRGTLDNLRITTQSGAFTFVDATPANTTLNSDPENFPAGVVLEAGSNYINDGSGGSGTDALWTYRTDVAFAGFEGGTAFESDNVNTLDDGEATADLITSVNLPLAGTYDLVAVFTRNNRRDIAARVSTSPGSTDIFRLDNSLNTNQEEDSPDLQFDSSFTGARLGNSGAAYLGTVTTSSANEDVFVFVNGLVSTEAEDDERTQYDGIAYRLTTGSSLVPRLSDLTYNSVDGSAEVRIKSAPGVSFKLVSTYDLDFTVPAQDPVLLSEAILGSVLGNEVTTDSNGDAVVRFGLEPGQARAFIRAVVVP